MRKLIKYNGTSKDDYFNANSYVAGDFVYSGKAGNDSIFGSYGNDRFKGDGGQDAIYGGGGDDILRGGDGPDGLDGDDGNDKIYGDSGNDIISGGGGRDVLRGGAGADSFVFFASEFDLLSSDVDVVKDFTAKGRNHDTLTFAIQSVGNQVIDTLDDLQPYMFQRGKDLHIIFEAGDTMIVENTKRRELTEDNFYFDPSMF